MLSILRRLLSNEQGATLIEYALIGFLTASIGAQAFFVVAAKAT
jgi:Flp pilus assembly pilin Flp